MSPKKERVTNQKKLILDYLKSVKIHPSAQDVYLAVRKKLPQISKGTVYRNLKSLREKSYIREISSEVSRFDGNILPHSHFICNECRKIFDVMDNSDAIKNIKNKKVKEGKIFYYQVYYYGICKECHKVRR